VRVAVVVREKGDIPRPTPLERRQKEAFYFAIFFFSFCYADDGTQGLVRAKQVLSH
jgi:hypothetical protein